MLGVETPTDRRYTKEHEWARVEGELITIGITDFAQDQLGDVVYVELPKLGAQVKRMVPFGVVESVKTASDLFSPVNGEVVGVNDDLGEHPELVNSSPYDAAWLIKVRPSDVAELDQLLTAEEYDSLTRQ